MVPEHEHQERLGLNDLGDLGPHKLCPGRHPGQCRHQSPSSTSQKLFISQSTPRPEYTCQKWSLKTSTELCGFYEYILSCRDNDGAFDMPPNLPTDQSV